MEKNLHIVWSNVQYPASSEILVDAFYKLVSLKQQGVNIYLHCFNDDNCEEDELKKYCVSVNYYKCTEGHKSISPKLPYIIASRKNEALLINLLLNNYPIFMDGLNCTYLLNDERFANRKKFVRVHNVEYQYYYDLYQSTTNPLKKIYYWRESNLLKKYEQFIVEKVTAFWGVTHKDVDFYKNKYACKTIDYLSLYLPPNWEVKVLTGIGNYCLFQADFNIEANEKAAVWLLEKVFSKIKVPFVIAGNNPSEKLQRLAHSRLHTCLVINPSAKELQDMIAKAQINILPSYSNTGIQLSLINALFNGRHALVNTATVDGSGLEVLCHIANDAETFIQFIEELHEKPLKKTDIEVREKLLKNMFNNLANAQQQIQWIWTDCA